MELDSEILIGFITIAIGLVAWIWSLQSRRDLAGGSLKRYTQNFLIAISFLVLFSVWHTFREALHLKEAWGSVAELPEYLLIMATYVTFLISAYQMRYISEEYSFKEQASTMKKALSEGKKKK